MLKNDNKHVLKVSTLISLKSLIC